MITFTILLITALVLIVGLILFTIVIGGASIMVFGDALICVGLIYLIVMAVNKIKEKRGS